MTHEKAKRLGFDLVMLPPTATELIQTVREFHEHTGRERCEFIHEIAGFKLHCLGLLPRKGEIAPAMKLLKEKHAR